MHLCILTYHSRISVSWEITSIYYILLLTQEDICAEEYQQNVHTATYPHCPSFPNSWDERDCSQPRYTGNNNSSTTYLWESSNLPLWDMKKVTHSSCHQANIAPCGRALQTVYGKNQITNERQL